MGFFLRWTHLENLVKQSSLAFSTLFKDRMVRKFVDRAKLSVTNKRTVLLFALMSCVRATVYHRVKFFVIMRYHRKPITILLARISDRIPKQSRTRESIKFEILSVAKYKNSFFN